MRLFLSRLQQREDVQFEPLLLPAGWALVCAVPGQRYLLARRGFALGPGDPPEARSARRLFTEERVAGDGGMEAMAWALAIRSPESLQKPVRLDLLTTRLTLLSMRKCCAHELLVKPFSKELAPAADTRPEDSVLHPLPNKRPSAVVLRDLGSNGTLSDDTMDWCLAQLGCRAIACGEVKTWAAYDRIAPAETDEWRLAFRAAVSEALSSRVALPLHDQGHWVLVVADNGFYILDSLPSFTRAADRLVATLEFLAPRGWPVAHVPVPRQQDTVSCGLHVVEAVRALSASASTPDAWVNFSIDVRAARQALYEQAVAAAQPISQTISLFTPPAVGAAPQTP